MSHSHQATLFEPRPLDTKSVLHEIRVMTRKLRNVTITLDEETARWARIEAARRDTSVSRLIGEMVQERMYRDESYEGAMERYLAKAPGVHRRPGQSYPSRDELHERDRLR